MRNLGVGVLVYLIIGLFMALGVPGRSKGDYLLDTILWPVILYYHLTIKYRMFK